AVMVVYTLPDGSTIAGSYLVIVVTPEPQIEPEHPVTELEGPWFSRVRLLVVSALSGSALEKCLDKLMLPTLLLLLTVVAYFAWARPVSGAPANASPPATKLYQATDERRTQTRVEDTYRPSAPLPRRNYLELMG